MTRQNARVAGLENLPAASTTVPTEFECRIVRDLEHQHRERADETRSDLHDLLVMLTAAVDQLPNDRDLAAAVAGTAADVDRELGTAGALVEAWAERERHLRNLRAFMREHGRARHATYPDSPWLHLALVAIVGLLETWANSGFFVETSDFGLVGGFVGALGVSAINILSGFFAGWLILPWLNYRDRTAQTLSAVGLTAVVGAALVFNLAVAGYRDILSTGRPLPVSAVDLIRDPFHLTFVSSCLLAAGVLAWGFSFRKGATFDDPYPFYGAYDRRFRRAHRWFCDERDRVVARVVGRIQRVPIEIQVLLRRGSSELARVDEIVTEARHVLDAYETDRQDLRLRCTALLKAWREENSFVRTDPMPRYFDDFPEFECLVPEDLAQNLKDRAVCARAAHADVEARAQQIIAENGQRVAVALARFREHVSDMMENAINSASIGSEDGWEEHAR
jgi:hypothetical protein